MFVIFKTPTKRLRMKTNTGILLGIMMFIEYFIWGAWYVTMTTYMPAHLNSNGVQIGAAYSALSIATMISPFFVGMVADRYFSAQKIMGILHLIGAGLLFLTARVESNSIFYWCILSYSLLYMPTIALSNSIAFHQMSDPGKQFPWIRVFGTLGWIVAGFVIGQKELEKTSTAFIIAAGASVVLGLFSFVLPNTPPKGNIGASASKALGTEAFILFKSKPYVIFFIAAILV